MEILITIVGIITIIPFLSLYVSFSWGYVATIISAWFIQPLFPEFPVFTWLQFAGIMFFINCFTNHGSSQVKKEYKDETQNLITLFLSPWLLLFAAWILHLIY